jgi:hypothetical protein
MEINKDVSYMIGLFQTDGSMYENTRNRGRFSLELAIRDKDIIYKLKDIIPYHSGIKIKRKYSHINNHEYNNEFISLKIYNITFRDFLIKSGVPYGKKSNIIKPPLYLKNLSINDYIRGLYDGDGSLGITAQKFPYVSFTTKSDDIATFLCENISRITSKSLKNIKRNKRDDIYNIVITKEDAQYFCNEIYYDGCLSMNRKIEKSNEVKSWIRSNDMIRIENKKYWTPKEDEYILSHTIEESMNYLDRTEKSVKIRLWRLKNK